MKRLAVPLLLFAAVIAAHAYPRPAEGTENIPKLVADATLVCKGEVVEASEPQVATSRSSVPSATALVEPDRCFKGAHLGRIPVLFDGFIAAGGGPSFVLRKGDYRLLFLRPERGEFAVVDQWFGALPVSRKLASPSSTSDPLLLLEEDFKAGLSDAEHERVLDSIRMLGNLRRVHSLDALHAMLNSSDLLVQTYTWQACFRLKDYSVLSAVEAFLKSQPEPPHYLIMPRDRLFAMQFELFHEISVIREPAALPSLERFAAANKVQLRTAALDALRQIGSSSSAPVYLRELDDSNADNAFSAMQGLLTIRQDDRRDWVPSWEEFRRAPQYYANKCREWWNSVETHARTASSPRN